MIWNYPNTTRGCDRGVVVDIPYAVAVVNDGYRADGRDVVTPFPSTTFCFFA